MYGSLVRDFLIFLGKQEHWKLGHYSLYSKSVGVIIVVNFDKNKLGLNHKITMPTVINS